jgi:hypothetical protein
MGSGKYEIVGKSQPVLIMINPMISPRTRSHLSAPQPALRPPYYPAGNREPTTHRHSGCCSTRVRSLGLSENMHLRTAVRSRALRYPSRMPATCSAVLPSCRGAMRLGRRASHSPGTARYSYT